MAFDGITIANMVKEFQDTHRGGKINKIAQPEADEPADHYKEQYKPSTVADLRQRFFPA